MKTPSFLPAVLLAAALPSHAAIVAPARCDVEFLEKVAKDYNGPASMTDPRLGTASRTVDRNTVTSGVLKIEEANLCDMGTRLHLATGPKENLVWRNPKLKEAWDKGDAKNQAGLVLVAVDFYKSVDPRIQELLDAANGVLSAGIALGVAAPVEPVQAQADFLKANSGGPFLASVSADAPIKPATMIKIVPLAEQKANVTPQSVGPTWRAVLDDAGTPAGGAQVLRFRMAVMALAADIARAGQNDMNVMKRAGGKVPGVTDFTPGSGNVAPPSATKADAIDDKKFDSALALLIGPGATPKLDDASPRGKALLEPVDIGVRNLVAIRSDQIKQIVDAAKARLAARKETIAQIETAARGQIAAGAKPENVLGASVLRRLSETDDYQSLNRMYENAVAKGTPAGNAEASRIKEQRDAIEAAALSSTVEDDGKGNKVVVFTQNGKKTVLKNIVPETLENETTRGNAAGVIARFIVEGAKTDAKYAAVMAAIRNESPSAGLNNQRERDAANQVPPAVKKVKDTAQGCEKPSDLIDNDHEIYAARQRAAAAEVTTDDIRARTKITQNLQEELAKNKTRCDKEDADAAAIQAVDDFESPASLKGRRDAAAAKAKADCETRRAAIQKVADDARAERTRIEGTRSEATLLEAASKELTASFKISVHASADALRRDYLDPKSKRHRDLLSDAKMSEKSSARALGYIEYWFNDTWPLLTEDQLKRGPDDPQAKKLSAAIDACATKLGLGTSLAGKSDPSYKNPEKPGVVDDECGVHKGVTDYVAKQKGTVD